ncbi:winged helix-turn-helix domain-containing protein [Aliikangiella coralliicola]|uniref:Tetratricopeptide repeat protein n=1 Tax=Aliikangiella coralliicola TaxID=2592383 RepID=A0A545UB20_9GAMM|nr:winged helix-turn-helix domain-containing protein [Aliikangiella coralliicola]TQV86659.1 tetratricopeptide repeat protein [Aliikangiella coralliicola]
MFKTSATKRQFQIEDIKLDPETGQVWRGTEEISLPKLSFQLLRVLVENSPNVLEQEELIGEVWPDMVVGDETLKQRVRLLRKALGDNAQSPKYIGVVRGRGYRLLPEVKILLINQTTPIEYDLASSDRVPNLFTSNTQKLWQNISLALSAFIALLLISLFILSNQLSQKSKSHSLQHLAILPFVNITQNPEDNYLASGMTTELIQVMSEIETLKVSSQQAVQPYARTERSISKIATQLDVGSILDGSLYRQNNLLHLKFKLINTNTSDLLWQAEYDFESDDILAIQRKVISQITSRLKAKLNKSQVLDSLSLTQPTQVVKAYDLYLRGRDYYSRYRQTDNQTAINLYQQSLKLDPTFALAYAGLADAYSQGVYQFGAGESWRKLALESARQSVTLGEERAESHKALGLAYYLNGQLKQAIQSNLRAIKLSPRHAQAATNLAYLYRQTGQLANAMKWNLRAAELNPNYATVYAHLGQTLESLQVYDKAEESYLRALQLQPDYVLATRLYADYLAIHDHHSKAKALISDAIKTFPQEFSYLLTAGEIELYQGQFLEAFSFFQQASLLPHTEENLELQLLLAVSQKILDQNNDDIKQAKLMQVIDAWHNLRIKNITISELKAKNSSFEGIQHDERMKTSETGISASPQIVNRASENPRDYFLLAIALSAINKPQSSAEALIEAINRGWTNLRLINHLPLFREIRQLPELKTALKNLQNRIHEQKQTIKP